MLNLLIQAKILLYLFIFSPTPPPFPILFWQEGVRVNFFFLKKRHLVLFPNHRHVTDSTLGEDNIALMLSLWGWRWLCLELASLWLSTICVRNSQSQTKEIGKVFFLSVLQSLKIAIKHLDKISRWWQGKENDQSQALLNPLNITYSLDVAVTRRSLIFGELSGSTSFPGCMTTGGTR